MKYFPLLFAALLFFACKNDLKKEVGDPNSEEQTDSFQDSLRVTDRDLELRERTLNLKRKELLEKVDQREELENMVISQSFYKEDELLTLDFQYPYLNEKINTAYSHFNDYIKNRYLDSESIEKQMREEKRLCDSLGIPKDAEKRIVEYKIYNLNNRLLSVLFYKENHYSGAAHAAYTFETLNFDLERSEFMDYEDFFNAGSEEELREIINEQLREKINSGDVYYDCWEISADDFFHSKNNFVVTEDAVEFYFDDCVICSSYTGTYSIKIPLESLMPVLRKHKKNPLII